MTTRKARMVVGSTLVTLLVVGFGGPAVMGQSGELPIVSRAQYDAWFDELSLPIPNGTASPVNPIAIF